MNSSLHRITLDVAEAASHSAVTLRQGENAHRLEINFTDNGLPYRISGECYAVLAARKSDGTQLLNACSIVNDTVIYTLTAQTTAAPGRLECEVRLYGENSKLLIAPKFSMFVEDSTIDESGIESSDEFSALNDLISRAATVSVFRIKGYFESAEDLERISSPSVGDTYGIGTESPYEIYVWDAVNGEWVNHGTLQGEPGEPGQDGQDGAPGQPGQTGPQGVQGVSGVYVGEGEAPESCNVQIDPNGSADELVTEAPKDNKQYARKNGEWAEVEGGSDAEVTAENIAEALGYTPADEDDLSGKLDKSGGTMTGDITMSSGNALNFTSNMAINLSTASMLSAYGTPNTSGAIEKIGSHLFNLTIRGRQTRPDYTDVQNNTSSMALLSDVRNPKTTLPAVAEVNTQYYLGTQSAVNIVLPSGAETGQEITVVWYNGATAATLSISGTTIGRQPTPSANSRTKIVFEWDGLNWGIESSEIPLN